MKFYTSVGPNPRVVKMFAVERGIELPSEIVDLRGGDNRRPPYTNINAFGQMPALELDNGEIVTEITAICEYLDETHPGPSLIGSTAEERSQTRRWLRWADLNICEPIGHGFRFGEGIDLFKERIRCLPEASQGFKAIAQDNIAFLDGQLANNEYLTGSKVTLVDIHLFCFIDFGRNRGQPLNDEFTHVGRWIADMEARPSADASVLDVS